jgi:hypothetical protein
MQVYFSQIHAVDKGSFVTWTYKHGKDVDQTKGGQFEADQCPCALFMYRSESSPSRAPSTRVTVEVSANYSLGNNWKTMSTDWLRRRNWKTMNFVHVLELKFPSRQDDRQWYRATQVVSLDEATNIQPRTEASQCVVGKPSIRKDR